MKSLTEFLDSKVCQFTPGQAFEFANLLYHFTMRLEFSKAVDTGNFHDHTTLMLEWYDFKTAHPQFKDSVVDDDVENIAWLSYNRDNL